MSQSLIKQTRYFLHWQEKLAYAVYCLFVSLLTPCIFLYGFVNGLLKRAPLNSHSMTRFGVYPRATKTTDLLIHCVSVGEVNVAIGLIKSLQLRQPDITVTVTTTTVTGFETLRRQFENEVQHVFLPLDTVPMVNNLLTTIAPRQVWIVEVELWPTLLRQCDKQGIPVNLANGRMSDRSTDRYNKLSLLFNPMIRNLAVISAQSLRDVGNYRKFDVEYDRIQCVGNMKFDLPLPDPSLAASIAINKRPAVIAGSTHDSEEHVVIEAFSQLITQFPDAILFIVPRHPQRFQDVENVLKHQQLAYQKYSERSDISDNTQIVLVDEMGVLSHLYPIMKIAFVGGSLTDKGGHNALEAAQCGLPVLMGPYTYNNPEICDSLQQAGNLFTVNTSADIVDYCSVWLNDEPRRQQAGKNGLDLINKNRGAAERTLDLFNVSPAP